MIKYVPMRVVMKASHAKLVYRNCFICRGKSMTGSFIQQISRCNNHVHFLTVQISLDIYTLICPRMRCRLKYILQSFLVQVIYLIWKILASNLYFKGIFSDLCILYINTYWPCILILKASAEVCYPDINLRWPNIGKTQRRPNGEALCKK